MNEFERILTSISDHVVRYDGEWRYTYVNDGAVRILGRPREELLGRRIWDLFPEAVGNQYHRELSRAFAEQTVIRSEHYYAPWRRWFENHIFPTPDGVTVLSVDISARKQAEAAAEESRRRLVDIVESLADPFVALDHAGRVTHVNEAALRLVRRTRGKMIGRPYREAVPMFEGTVIVAAIAEVLATREPRLFEFQGPISGRWYETCVHPLADGVSVISRDIHERKTAAELVQVVSDGVPALLAYVDAEGRYRLNNRAYELWFGRPAAEYTGRLAWEVVGDTAWAAIRPHFEAVLAGQVVSYDAEVPYKDGGTRWVTATYTPDFGRAGEVRGYVSHVVDVTTRKRAEVRLAEAESRFRKLADNLPSGFIYQLHRDGDRRRFTYLSGGVKPLLGVAVEEALADPLALYGLICPDDQAIMRAAEEEATRGRRPYECQFRVRTRAGELRWLHTRAAARPHPGGGAIWDGVAMDITERVRAEETLRVADRRKDEFLATLAHELRNPLAPMRNALQILLEAEGDPVATRHAREVMARQLGHMVRLIDDLLDISRITRDKLELRRERVELAAMVHSAVETARPLIDELGHALRVRLPGAPVHLDADFARLSQVFANLLTNAAKYTDRGGHIELAAEVVGEEVAVSVRDDGIGIAADDLPRLFQMFSQVGPALERSQGGLGIGLALVRALVEMHGGRIAADSEGPGKGSRFTVHLPLAAEAGEAGAAGGAAAGPPEPGRAGGRRILVADDNRDGADSLAMMLTLLGNDVRVAYDGKQAAREAALFRPEIGLLDIGMPGMHGYDLARHIRSHAWGERMFLVALTGWGQDEDKRRAREAGFDHHLTKPIEFAALDSLLAAYARR